MDPASLSTEHSVSIRPVIMKGWTDEAFQELLTMYTNKVSLKNLAVHFQKTRGQISGTIFRAREKGLVGSVLTKVVKPPPAPKAPKPPVNPGTVHLALRLQTPKVKKRMRLRLIEDDNRVTFAQLEPHHCRWPFGEPRQSDFRFCGCRRENEKQPYCAKHNVMAGRMYDKPQAQHQQQRRPFYHQRRS